MAITYSIHINDLLKATPFAAILKLDKKINPTAEVNVASQANNTNSTSVQPPIIEFLTVILMVISGIAVFKLK